MREDDDILGIVIKFGPTGRERSLNRPAPFATGMEGGGVRSSRINLSLRLHSCFHSPDLNTDFRR